MDKPTCNIGPCSDLVHARGLCPAHYARWRRYGDPEGGRHVYRLDEGYFDAIDTEAKAYWLGFITADGCVQAGSVGAAGWQRHQVSVKLKESDAPHLEKLKDAVSAESPVRFVPQARCATAAVEISLSSVHLVETLISLGVTPRKSLTVEPWRGPDGLMRHYWRGMVDGDGTIVRHPVERAKWHLALAGTRASVEAFRAWAVPICGSSARSYPKGNIWQWTIGGLSAPQAVVRELYGDATVFLDRKRELALELMGAQVRHRSRCGRHVAARAEAALF